MEMSNELLLEPIGDFDIDPEWNPTENLSLSSMFFADDPSCERGISFHGGAEHNDLSWSSDSSLEYFIELMSNDESLNSYEGRGCSLPQHEKDERDHTCYRRTAAKPLPANERGASPQNTPNGGSVMRSGNMMVMAMVKTYQPIYADACRSQKYKILKQIYNQSTANGSRFLDRKVASSGYEEWCELSKKNALLKIRGWLLAGSRKQRRRTVPVFANVEALNTKAHSFKAVHRRRGSPTSVSDLQSHVLAR